jgi:hypothetical protein
MPSGEEKGDLQRAIPDLAACWETATSPMPSPAERHAYLVRFMHDVQGCAYWYLYLCSDGTSSVVSSLDLYEPDEADDISLADFLDSTMWVAPGFEQFMYRYWIEGVALYQVVHSEKRWKDLSPEVREYLDHYRKPDAAPLDVWLSAFPAAALRAPTVEVPGQVSCGE